MKPLTPPSLRHMKASPGQVGALGAGAGVQRGAVGGQVDEDPVPEAAGRRGVRVEAGDREALGVVREAGPGQLRRAVASGVDLVVLERLAVGHVVAGDGERRDAGQQVVRVGGDGAVEAHHGSFARGRLTTVGRGRP